MNTDNLIQLIYDDMQEMKKQQTITNERLDRIDKRFEKVDEHFKGIDKRFEKVDEHFKGIDKRFEKIDERFREIDERFDSIDKRFDSLEAKVLENTEEIKKINLCLENEIRPSIMRIAEGHLDLNRKLDEALKIDQQKETMVLRLNFLEGKVERLETKVAGLV